MDIEKQLGELRVRLGLGVKVQLAGWESRWSILWIRHNDKRETWEILPEWVANLVLLNLPYGGARRAVVYRCLPVHAPNEVVRLWLRLHLGGDYESISAA